MAQRKRNPENLGASAFTVKRGEGTRRDACPFCRDVPVDSRIAITPNRSELLSDGGSMTNKPLANQRHGFAASLALPKAKPYKKSIFVIKNSGIELLARFLLLTG